MDNTTSLTDHLQRKIDALNATKDAMLGGLTMAELREAFDVLSARVGGMDAGDERARVTRAMHDVETEIATREGLVGA